MPSDAGHRREFSLFATLTARPWVCRTREGLQPHGAPFAARVGESIRVLTSHNSIRQVSQSNIRRPLRWDFVTVVFWGPYLAGGPPN